ncbi:hypothetical protein MM236_00745 [Belliella sp. DSM 107340]|uniref:Uncharacterized protein n=1 Tax=Belliella calami TaxID=2923436 RepID=A0ABS9UIP7_9BACT|nr:hypothetical protein [Belliella calami]MCH7396487.1 hypothetical protein [Belliella calami]
MSNQVEIGFWEVDIKTGDITTSKSLDEILEVRENICFDFKEFLDHIQFESERFRVLRKIKKSISHNKSFSEIINFISFENQEPIKISIVGKPGVHSNSSVKMTGIALKYNDVEKKESVFRNFPKDMNAVENSRLEKNIKKLCHLTIQQKVVLTEVRYFISHKIMNHVANLIGLYDIYSDLDSDCDKKEFVDYMGVSISKLDNELRLIYERIEEVDLG